MMLTYHQLLPHVLESGPPLTATARFVESTSN